MFCVLCVYPDETTEPGTRAHEDDDNDEEDEDMLAVRCCCIDVVMLCIFVHGNLIALDVVRSPQTVRL